jgi:outer membrane protein assembly factor BamB
MRIPLLFASLCCLCLCGESSAGDWLHWRGPLQTGVAPDTDLPARWSPDPNAKDNNLVWKAPYGGRSSPLIMNDRVYFMNSAGEGLNEQERVLCLDADTGKLLWEHRVNVFFTDIVSARLGWAAMAGDPETGYVYGHGVQGLLLCFDRDGKLIWSRSLTEEYGRITGYGGRINSPIVDGPLVIMGMINASWGDQARTGNRFVAFDKRTGQPVWWSQPSELVRGTYSSIPVVHDIGGVRQLITGTSGGELLAIKVGTGEKLWSYPVGLKSINSSPVVQGSRVYIGYGEELADSTEQGRVVCVDAAEIKDGKPKRIWQVDGITARYASPILHEDRLYITDESGRIFCLDANTGDQLWKHKFGGTSYGSPVLADGKIYVGEVKSRFHILKPGAKKCEDLHAQYFRAAEAGTAIEINGSPAVADGRVYFMTSDETYCIGRKKGVTAPQSKSNDRKAQTGNESRLLIYPADVVLAPGQTQDFKLRSADGNGEPQKVTWALAGAAGQTLPPLQGTITPDGKLTVAAAPAGQFGTVVAKAGDQTAVARVRVISPPPVQQNFQEIPEGGTPAGWVNAQGKFAVVNLDGAKVLQKLANNSNPLLARAYTYLGVPQTKHYTIEAEVRGVKKGDDMPDVGIVNCRYTLILDGNKQRLRICSWEALPRVDHRIDFAWKPDTWYHMKLAVSADGAQGQIRGKVWPRGEKEPSQWTIEFADPAPNREGSPGLYAYATGILDDGQPGAAAYFANVKVSPTHESAK